MARQFERLKPLSVERLKNPGYFPDGGGLYLQVSPSGSKSWIFRFTLSGRAREMGLGPYPTIGLAEARGKANDCRRQLLEGIDPITARNAERQARQLAAANMMTFDECAKAYVASHRAGWKNSKHADQWENTLRDYVSPVFGSVPVAAVDTGLVMRALERDSLWTAKAETASRLRGRIENILSWATVRGYRSGDNPARWKGHLEELLPHKSKVARTEHHPALPYPEIGDFFVILRKQEGIAAKALEFTILTAARTGEVIGAQWDEIDFAEKVWTVPAERMKAKKEHRAPLCARALAILEELQQTSEEGFVFPGRSEGASMSNMAMLQLLRRMGRDDLTVHGFRSTFRDWAAERTNYPREVAEMALAHTVSDKVEAAYRRGDLFDKRRRMMEEWQRFCETPSQTTTGEVVEIRRLA
ncbi:MAG: site-specific integrase [Rhodocyclaceae bacterium]|nr:MAG: site-specific integrase [Rhodocyclaceae bacterium]